MDLHYLGQKTLEKKALPMYPSVLGLAFVCKGCCKSYTKTIKNEVTKKKFFFFFLRRVREDVGKDWLRTGSS